MASRFACQRLAFLHYSWRVMLLAIFLLFAGRMCWAEYQYEMGIRTTSLQASLDALTAAALAYPYQRRFRTGQAIQLFEMAKRMSGLIEPATISAERALVIDPHFVDLLSRLILLKAAQGQCASAERSHLTRLAPRSKKVQSFLASNPC